MNVLYGSCQDRRFVTIAIVFGFTWGRSYLARGCGASVPALLTHGPNGGSPPGSSLLGCLSRRASHSRSLEIKCGSAHQLHDVLCHGCLRCVNTGRYIYGAVACPRPMCTFYYATAIWRWAETVWSDVMCDVCPVCTACPASGPDATELLRVGVVSTGRHLNSSRFAPTELLTS
jgi:hypothetical protein